MKNLINKLKRVDLLLFAACVLFFLWQPYFDIHISQLFFDQESGFFLNTAAWAEFIFHATNIVGLSLVIALCAVVLVSVLGNNKKLKKRKKVAVYLLVCALFGPVLITDTLLKKYWDRPRPQQTDIFGGQYQFEPPFSPTFTCDVCESFVSGHAATGFFLFSFVLLQKVGSRRRKQWLLGALLTGGIIGFTRIAQGGHFLSDVVFAGFTVWFSSLLVHKLFYGQKV